MPCDRCNNDLAKCYTMTFDGDQSFPMFCDYCATLYAGSIQPNPITAYDVSRFRHGAAENYTLEYVTNACRWVYANHLLHAYDYYDLNDPEEEQDVDRAVYNKQHIKNQKEFKKEFPYQYKAVYDVCLDIIRRYLRVVNGDIETL